MASPRVIDRRLVERTLAEMQACAEREDIERTLELLAHIVPEYSKAGAETAATAASSVEADT